MKTQLENGLFKTQEDSEKFINDFLEFRSRFIESDYIRLASDAGITRALLTVSLTADDSPQSVIAFMQSQMEGHHDENI